MFISGDTQGCISTSKQNQSTLSSKSSLLFISRKSEKKSERQVPSRGEVGPQRICLNLLRQSPLLLNNLNNCPVHLVGIMAGDDDINQNQKPSNNYPDPSRKPPQWPDDDNPFVAFRRFADEQISSMLQSVMGLPSMTSPPQSGRWAVFSESNNYNSSNHREGEYPSGGSQTESSGDSHCNTPRDYEKPVSTKQTQWEESSDPWHWHHRRRDNSFSDFFGFGSFFDRFWLDDHLPLSSRIFPPSTHHSIFSILDGDEDTPMWPVMYVMTSPYSPLQLEREARYRAHRDHDQGMFSSLMSSLKLSSEPDQPYDRDPNEPEWRDAFEDLLRIKYGKPMLDRESGPIRRQQPEKDWLAGLVQRGSLGEGWKYIPSQSGSWFTNQRKEERAIPEETGVETDQKDQEAETPATELDMHERFIQDIEAREREFSRQFHDSPILRFLSEDRQRHKKEIAAHRARLAEKENQNQEESTDDWIDLVSGGNKSTVPDTAEKEPEHLPSTDSAVSKPHVISTSTTTERVTRADGSVHTKTVKTKRFSDGREESNESVETTSPPQASAGQDPSSNNESSNGGWFWKR